ncbi:Extracellular ligand-binding receptor [Candidatus Rhodobacter oscarellae]|uniref:Extracellular ligand-binding receptor n=1 Tax=Candidatus Rhodobacter oscarellae TaxID=1675527 RepID=A0A0J9E9D6_9RHOB|nr:Extracellular ligand-binding receptor [Candidatus Rhodobacter lobularis]
MPALLLPLTGSNAGLGQRMAKAVWLQEDLGGLPRRTLVLDAGETPEQAVSAAQDATQRGANLLIGPLLRDQTPSVVRAAGQVPVMTLSNDNALAQAGAWVFGVTPKQSADAVLRYAKSARSKRVVLLDSGDALSARAASALDQGARKAGIARVTKIPASTASEQIANALRQAGGGEMPDILYVPASDDRAQSQAIAAVGAGVTTIGSLQWSGLSRDAFLRLDKACYTGPDPVQFNRLSAAYMAQLDEQMGVIAALAVDAVALAHQVGGGPALDRKKPAQGLLGQYQFLPDRTLKRELAVLRINGGAVERVA